MNDQDPISSPRPGTSLSSVRRQTALVRALLDAVDRITVGDGGMSAQVVKELGRLGCRCVGVACALAAAMPSPEAEADGPPGGDGGGWPRSERLESRRDA